VDWAKIGVRCECINDEGFDVVLKHGMRIPVRGTIYTIRDVQEFGTGAGLLLDEVLNDPARWSDGLVFEAAWQVECFRPLPEHTVETDMEVFEPLLTANTEPA
jgi:hypothetical protein